MFQRQRVLLQGEHHGVGPARPALPGHGRRRALQRRRHARPPGSCAALRDREGGPCVRQSASHDTPDDYWTHSPPRLSVAPHAPSGSAELMRAHRRDWQCHGCHPPLSVREAVAAAAAVACALFVGRGRRHPGCWPCRRWGLRPGSSPPAQPSPTRPASGGPRPRPCAWQAVARRRPRRRPGWRQGGRQGHRAAHREWRWRVTLGGSPYRRRCEGHERWDMDPALHRPPHNNPEICVRCITIRSARLSAARSDDGRLHKSSGSPLRNGRIGPRFGRKLVMRTGSGTAALPSPRRTVRRASPSRGVPRWGREGVGARSARGRGSGARSNSLLGRRRHSEPQASACGSRRSASWPSAFAAGSRTAAGRSRRATACRTRRGPSGWAPVSRCHGAMCANACRRAMCAIWASSLYGTRLAHVIGAQAESGPKTKRHTCLVFSPCA